MAFDIEAQRDLLRAALAKLIGVYSVPELQMIEAAIRASAAAAEDKADILDAIHALIATAK